MSVQTTNLSFIPQLDAFIVYSDCKTQYAFGVTSEEAAKKFREFPRTPRDYSPRSSTTEVAELIATGKISDETRLEMLDHMAHRVLEML